MTDGETGCYEWILRARWAVVAAEPWLSWVPQTWALVMMAGSSSRTL